MPKYVASTTLTEPLQWNASLIKGDVAEEVEKLKRDRNLLVNGSGKLTQSLLRHALVDDFRIWIHPVVLGDGERLFTDGSATTAMKLRDTGDQCGGGRPFTPRIDMSGHGGWPVTARRRRTS